MRCDGEEDPIHHILATSQHGWVEVWKKSRGTRGIALDREHWGEVLQGWLIITPDGTWKKDLVGKRRNIKQHVLKQSKLQF